MFHPTPPVKVLLQGLACLLLAVTQWAAAACDPQPSVGDPARDKACTYTTIQSALDAACTNATVLVTPTLTYTAQALQLKDAQLTLAGASQCGNVASIGMAGQVTIDGAGHTGDSVVTLKGFSIANLRFLNIIDGQEGADNHGGGVFADGKGSLTLDNVTVRNNVAGWGGGIYVKGEDDDSLLWVTLGDNVFVTQNHANHDGGGVYVEGTGRIVVNGANTGITANIADGNGGGIGAQYPADVYIGSPGRSIAGVTGPASWIGAVDGNSAVNGGGIALLADAGIAGSCEPPAMLTMFTTDPQRPVQVSGNHASNHGGAIYWHPDWGALSTYCPVLPYFPADLHDFRFSNNQAPQGAALYEDWVTDLLETDIGSAALLNFGSVADDPGIPNLGFLGAKPCVSAECNLIETNTAADSSGTLSDGPVIMVGTSGTLYANRVQLRNNVAGNLIRILGKNDLGQGATGLYNVLVHDNRLSREVLRQEGDNAPVIIENSTFAHDVINAAFVLSIHDTLRLHNSLFGEVRTHALDFQGSTSNLDIDAVIALDAGGLTLGPSVFQTDPLFVAPASGDFHLQTGSPALDFAPTVAGETPDLAGNPRDVDLPGVTNRFGVRDLGAYEMQPINVAAATYGASATASSTGPTFPASAAIDGDRTGAGWPNAAGWRDNTSGVFPDWLQVTFAATHFIDHVTVTTLQDNYMNPVEPDDTLTFTHFGLTAYDVQVLAPGATVWTTVASITNNNLVKRTVTFTAHKAAAVRLLTRATPDNLYSRVVELEAFGW